MPLFRSYFQDVFMCVCVYVYIYIYILKQQGKFWFLTQMLIIQNTVIFELILHDGPGLFGHKYMHMNTKKRKRDIFVLFCFLLFLFSFFLVVNLHTQFQVIKRQEKCYHRIQILHSKKALPEQNTALGLMQLFINRLWILPGKGEKDYVF